MSYIKIEIPQKGNVYLVNKDFADEFIGDQQAIDYLYSLFVKAQKDKVQYSWFDITTEVKEFVTLDKFAECDCDAIRAVLEHNNIMVPDDLPSSSERFRQMMKTHHNVEVIY
ncbi:Uncharacterised protein [Pasteurella multocida]|nr:Uncharacterised protein [Pasteurella multocida]